MSTIFYGEDITQLVDGIKKIMQDMDAVLVASTDLHGNMKAGTKNLPLRVPTAFSTDVLKQENSIPLDALFFGLMLLPKKDTAEEWLESSESTNGEVSADGD